jgi:hypothetical protein
MATSLPLKLKNFPDKFPIEGAVKIELVEGIPIRPLRKSPKHYHH